MESTSPPVDTRRVASGVHQVTVTSLDFAGAVAMCRSFELRYDRPTSEFYADYLRGGVEGHDAARWASYWRIAQALAPEPAEVSSDSALGVELLSA